MTTANQPLSLREYARRRGVSAEAVSKAITAGRLKESVVLIGGKPKIASVEIADREWNANTRPRVDHQSQRERAGGDDDDDEELPPGVPSYNVSRAVREYHAARREGALADVAEIDRDEKRNELVSVAEAREYIVDKLTTVKTRLLGLPSRVAQQLPHLAAEAEPVIDAVLREMLETLAAEPDGDGQAEEA